MTVPARPVRNTEAAHLGRVGVEGVRCEYWDGYVVPQHGYDDTGAVVMAGLGLAVPLVEVYAFVDLPPGA